MKQEKADAESGKKDKKGKKKDTPDPKDPPKDLTPEQKLKKDQAKELAPIEAEARKILTKETQVMAAVLTLKNAAQKMPEWAWLKGDVGSYKQLEELQQEVENAKSQFYVRYSTETAADVKKGYSFANLKRELQDIPVRRAGSLQ
eukprot:1023106-Pyramimonas_sp.AAC.1